jgi:integrase
MSVTSAHWATQQDQFSGETAAIRSMHSNDSAVRWIALSGCRVSEAQNAKLSEIDPARKTWTIPAARRKDYREHIIPITAPMADLLDKAMKHASGSAKGQEDYLFVMPRLARLKALKGIRAAFRQWATGHAKFSPEVVHAQLGHHPCTVESANSRKEMMEAWAVYLLGEANV